LTAVKTNAIGGTWKRYSKKAIPQLTIIASQSALWWRLLSEHTSKSHESVGYNE